MKKIHLNPGIKQILILILSTLTLLGPTNSANAIQKLDQVVAIVNDDVITQHELEARVDDYSNQLKLSSSASADRLSLRKQVLERMIQNKIQLQKAQQLGITVDDVTLNRMLENLAASNKMTLAKLKSTLAKENIEFGRFREQTREEIIIKQLQNRMVAERVTVSDQEVQQYINSNLNEETANTKYQLLHILVATPETTTPEVISQSREKAEQIYLDIQNGADFRKLAINKSDGRNALDGGSLGWRSANELPEAFVEALSKLNPGETSQPIQSASGFHILKLLDVSNNKTMITQTEARHILIKTGSGKTDDQVRKTLLEIKQRVEKGENFATLAKEYSQDPGSRERGGNLGWADPGQFVPEFEDEMKSLKIKQISEPFRTQFGWHILQVLDRREQDRTLSSIESKARASIRQRKIDEELRLWLRRIRDEAYVEYTDRNLIQD